MSGMTQHGFTLVESLIVLAILGLMFISTVPGLVSVHHQWKLYGAANELAAELERVRVRAVLANMEIRVKTGANQYSIEQSDLESRLIPLGSGLSFAGSPKTVLFTPHGTATPGVTLTLSYRSGRVCVIVSPAGRVRLAEPRP
jgi:type II secretion system protein H